MTHFERHWLFVNMPFTKEDKILETSRKYLPFGEKMVKIGPVDIEIALLILKIIKTRNAWQSLAYSPLGAAV